MFLKLKITLITTLLSATVCANSFKENFRVVDMKEGWFIGTAVGPQFYVGEFDKLQSAGHRISTAMEGQFGKWITKSIAARIQGSCAHVTGGNRSGKKDAMNMVNIHANCMVDIINVIKNVNEERKFTVLPFFGMGSSFRPGSPAYFSFDLGAQGVYRASKHINLFAEIKGILLNEKMDGNTGGSRGEGSAMLTAGFNFNF